MRVVFRLRAPSIATPRGWCAGALLLVAALLYGFASEPARAQLLPDPAFAEWLEGVRAEARTRRIPARLLDRAFAGLSPDEEIIGLLDNQPELEKAVWDYLDKAVSDERLMLGREALVTQRPLLDAIEAFYGVDRHVIVAIWGLESKYGANMGSRSVVRSLATLGYAGGRRADYGRKQLLAALEILAQRDVTPEGMVGSWAGAVGHTQFIPTTFLEHAVDFDRDGRRDLWGNVGDALASTALYLARSGWKGGEWWGSEVVLPRGLDLSGAGLQLKQPVGAWEQRGIRRADGKPFRAREHMASLLLPAGARGPAFLVSTNFRAILKYNNAVAYGLAIGHLADRLKGAQPLVAGWPREERPLRKAEREEMQKLLAARGYEVGEIDGVIGSRTKAALADYQRRRGLPADGFPTVSVLERLRGDAGT